MQLGELHKKALCKLYENKKYMRQKAKTNLCLTAVLTIAPKNRLFVVRNTLSWPADNSPCLRPAGGKKLILDRFKFCDA